MRVIWVIIQALGAVVTAGYEAYNLFQMVLGGKSSQDALHRWDLVVVFFLFIGFVAWAIIDRQIKLSKIENARPRLKWVCNKETPLYATKDDGKIKGNDYIYNALQIWFKNDPKIPTENAVARDVFATVTFHDKTMKTIKEFPVCFVVGNARDHAGNTGERLEKIEKWSPSEIGKLQIVVKRIEEDNAFGFTQGDLSERELRRGNYYIKVKLEGTGVVNFKPIWFNMVNNGKGSKLSLSDPIKRPIIYKTDYQLESV